MFVDNKPSLSICVSLSALNTHAVKYKRNIINYTLLRDFSNNLFYSSLEYIFATLQRLEKETKMNPTQKTTNKKKTLNFIQSSRSVISFIYIFFIYFCFVSALPKRHHFSRHENQSAIPCIKIFTLA